MTPEQLSRIVREHYPKADPIFTDVLRACATTGLPVSDALALLEKESGFANVFGHDDVRNPIKGGRVTRIRYRLYKIWRRAGRGMQGVGYCQLTWYALQDAADKLGGCWRPYPNMAVGFNDLRHLQRVHGREYGAAAYNGTGDAATAYGRDFLFKQRAWHQRLSA